MQYWICQSSRSRAELRTATLFTYLLRRQKAVYVTTFSSQILHKFDFPKYVSLCVSTFFNKDLRFFKCPSLFMCSSAQSNPLTPLPNPAKTSSIEETAIPDHAPSLAGFVAVMENLESQGILKGSCKSVKSH